MSSDTPSRRSNRIPFIAPILVLAAVGCAHTSVQQANVAGDFIAAPPPVTRWTPPTYQASAMVIPQYTEAQRVAEIQKAVSTNGSSMSDAELETLRRKVPSMWPVEWDGRFVMSPFGMRGTGRRADMHAGADIKAPHGEPVIATADGVVKFSGTMSGYGHIVILDHGDGIESRYAHLSQRQVEAGETVRRGEEVGKTGQTGRASTPHVHYEVRLNGEALDPIVFLPAS